MRSDKGERMIARMLRSGLMLPSRVVRRLARRYQARAGLAQLTSHPSPKLKAVGEALHETLANTMAAEERELVARIEERRTALLASHREISVIDYGAGKRKSGGTREEPGRTKEEMEVGVRYSARVADVCKTSKSRFGATVLFKLIRKLQPSSCVELGTCVGISASYQATALALNGRGRLVTLEGSPEIAGIAEETLSGLNLQNVSVVPGPFHDTLNTVMESSKAVDYFFNDGHHDHDAVIRYFNDALPYLSDDAVIVFDDISWSTGMRRAWTEIEDDERVAASIDLEFIGIALIGNNPATKEKFRIPLWKSPPQGAAQHGSPDALQCRP
jgi:predicted O-methyltransferase YrrM